MIVRGELFMLTSGINQDNMSRLISDIEECCRKMDKTLQYISNIVDSTEATDGTSGVDGTNTTSTNVQQRNPNIFLFFITEIFNAFHIPDKAIYNSIFPILNLTI